MARAQHSIGLSRTLAAILLSLLIGERAHADDGESSAEQDPRLQRPTVKVLSTDDEAAQGRFRFEAQIPPKVRHHLQLREFLSPQEVTNASYHQFEATGDEPVQIVLTYTPDNADDGAVGILASKSKYLEFCQNAKGSDHPGFTTFVSAVLRDLTPDQKRIRLAKPDSPWAQRGEADFIVFVVVPATTPADQPLDEVFPRAEFTIGPVPHLDRNRERQFQPGLLPRLQTLWDAQRGEIGTALIKYQHFATGGDDLQPLTPEEVQTAFQQLARSQDPDRLAVFAQQVTASDSDRAAQIAAWDWPVNELVEAGNKRRVIAATGRAHDDVTVIDGRFVMQIRHVLPLQPDYAQVNVSSLQSNWTHIPGLHDMREIPQLNPQMDWQVADKGDRLLITSAPLGLSGDEAGVESAGRDQRVEFEVKSLSGLLLRKLARIHGETRLTLQEDPLPNPHGVLFPRVSLEMRWRNGKPEWLSVHLIESAEFNTGVPPDAFRVSLPAGWQIIDDRRDTYRPAHIMVGEPIPNLAFELDKRDITAGK